MLDLQKDLIHALAPTSIAPAQILIPYLAEVYRFNLESHSSLFISVSPDPSEPAITSKATLISVEARNSVMTVRLYYENPELRKYVLHLQLSKHRCLELIPADYTGSLRRLVDLFELRSGDGTNSIVDLQAIYKQFDLHFMRFIADLDHVRRHIPAYVDEIRYRKVDGGRDWMSFDAAVRVLELYNGIHGKTATVKSLLTGVVHRDIPQDSLLTPEQFEYWVPRRLNPKVIELMKPFRDLPKDESCNCAS